jgi:hypothetical protein
MAERLKERLLQARQGGADLVAGPDAYRDLPRLVTLPFLQWPARVFTVDASSVAILVHARREEGGYVRSR